MAPCCCCGSPTRGGAGQRQCRGACWACGEVLGPAARGDRRRPGRPPRPLLARSLHTIHGRRALHRRRRRAAFDALMHRPAGGGLILELERAGPPRPPFAPGGTRAQAILSPIRRAGLRGNRAHLPRRHRLRPGHGLPLRRRRPWRGGGRGAAGRPRALSRQPLPRLRHPADRAAALCAEPRPGAGRYRLRAGAAGPRLFADHRRAPRHVAMLVAQHLADARAVPAEHGRRRDAGRLADGRRPAVGPGLLPPLRAALRPLRDPRRLRAAGRGDRHPHRRAGKLRPGPGRAAPSAGWSSG